MSTTLPATPFPTAWQPHYLSAGKDLEAPVGGVTQRILRLGDKWSISASYQKLRMDAYGRDWIAKIMLASRTTAVWSLPLPADGVGSPGTPLVNGAGQSGTSLAVDGLTAGYTFRAMQWLSIVHGGRRYLHMTTAGVTANGSGQATLPILPMLRVSPADNALVEVAAPKIEGLITLGPTWSVNFADIVDFSGNLTIAENR